MAWLNSGHDSGAVMWFRNAGNGTFEPPARVGQAQGPSALVLADREGDGDLDVLVVNHAGAPRLFRNESAGASGGAGPGWLRVAVEGTISNRDGRGAKLRVQVEADGPWQVREVGVGSHFLGEGELVQHFGLGEAETVHRVEVEWPASGLIQTLDAVAGGQTLVFVEGE